MTELSENRKQAIGGLGLGVLMGLIIGLSTSEVVALILGALTAILTAIFGISSFEAKENKLTLPKYVFLGVFGVFCFLSIIMGVTIRNHNFLSPSIELQVKKLKKADFTNEEIKNILLFSEYGIKPVGFEIVPAIKPESILMADTITQVVACDDFQIEKYDEILLMFKDSGVMFEKYALGIDEMNITEAQKKNLLSLFTELICKNQSNE